MTPVHYKGKMWCIKVATGAFVARRHGKIFITGNSGFPKSMDVAKAIDKHLGVKQKVVGHRETDPQKGFSKVKGMGSGAVSNGDAVNQSYDLTEATSDEARKWEGWGTCLKPAWEPIIVARKPLDGTVAHNVLTWGVGALNIDACRVAIEQGDDVFAKNPHTHSKGKDSGIYGTYKEQQGNWSGDKGRFPANLVHDGSQMVLDLFPDTGKSSGGGMHTRGTAGEETTNTYGSYTGGVATKSVGVGDSGSASRFFYCAKANKKDRGEGNDHPTVKPNALMRWLVRLVCPQGGTVLDPFMGSGSTGVACMQEGMEFVGIDKDKHYCDVADQRMRRELDGGIQRSMS